jgi:hypothetical protein
VTPLAAPKFCSPYSVIQAPYADDVLLPNVSFLLILVLVVALGLLPLFGVIDLWSKRRFASTEARIGWTIALVVAGLPALVVYVILVVRSKDRVPLLPAT